MDKRILKNLGKKTHDFEHRLDHVTNELRIETEKAFRTFLNQMESKST